MSSIFTTFRNFVEGVIHKLIPYKVIEQAEHFESPLSSDMENALNLWCAMFQNKSPWLAKDGMKSLNLPAFICSEIARQVLIENKWNITGKNANGETESQGEAVMNPRAEYISEEFGEKCMKKLREPLEKALAAGGMVIKPYPRDGKIYFDFVQDWSMYPIAFDGAGSLTDVIFRDMYVSGKDYYTRLERHRIDGAYIKITQKCYKATSSDTLGTQCALSDVPIWAELQPETTIENTDGKLLFGWFRVSNANSIDLNSPMGASVFAKAKDLIKDADEQYSRLMWEYEGSELAIDVDPTVLKPKQNGDKGYEQPHLNQRLFRAVDLGNDDTYNVFNPAIRDVSLLNGLNNCLCRVEDLCGLARGTLSDTTAQAMTATQLKILRQRSYATIADNQAALEKCLRDVVNATDIYATLYNLAPIGDIDISFEWDDSVITDTEQQLNERMVMLNAGVMGKAELREWYFGETHDQAVASIAQINQDAAQSMLAANGILGRNIQPNDNDQSQSNE